MIILDLGSANTCKNDRSIVKEMIDRIEENDSGQNEVVLKFQLFKHMPPNEPLGFGVFDYAYEYGRELGYDVTASIFDQESLDFLTTYDIPFIKIAARPMLYRFTNQYDKCIISVPPGYEEIPNGCKYLRCIPEYPATVEAYERGFSPEQLEIGISDHTEGFTLYHRYHPEIYEKHYVLERGGDNPDAGSFACVPEELVRLL